MMQFLSQQLGMDQTAFMHLYDSIAHEVSILVVFSFSLIIWKTFSEVVKKKQRKVADPSRSPRCKEAAFNLSGDASKTDAHPAVTPKALQQVAMEIISLSEGQYTCALRLYRELVRQGKDCYIREEAFYFSLVQTSIRVGHTDIAREVLQRAKKHKVDLSVQFFQSVFKLLASKQHFQDCLDIQQIFGNDLPGERTICSCIVLSGAEVSRPEIGIQAVEQLRSSGQEITGKDYQHIFRAFAKTGNHASSLQLFQMLINTGVPFEAVITNIVLATCVASHNADIAHALLTKATESNGAVPLDVVSYNTVIKGYARQHKLQECFDLIASMHGRGIVSDGVTYSTILDACIAQNCFDKANEVIDSFIASGCEMNTVLYTTFMKGFVRMEMLDKAMALYRQMRQGCVNGSMASGADGKECPKPDVILYSVLIKAHCDQRLLESALQLAKDMIQDGLEPDDMIINRLLDGCRHIRDGDTADRIFEEFIESGKIKPTLPTLATMVKTYGKCNRVDEAAHLVKTAYERFGLNPHVVLYTCLMSACNWNRRLDVACEAFDAMIKVRIEPDALTYSTLFKGCALERDFKRAVHIARVAASIKSQPYVFPAADIQSFISQMSATATGQGSIHLEALRAILRNHGQKVGSVESAPWRKTVI